MTHEELTKELTVILCILAERIERLENLLLEFLPEYFAQEEFLTKEILKAELNTLLEAKKIMPYKLKSKWD